MSESRIGGIHFLNVRNELSQIMDLPKTEVGNSGGGELHPTESTLWPPGTFRNKLTGAVPEDTAATTPRDLKFQDDSLDLPDTIGISGFPLMDTPTESGYEIGELIGQGGMGEVFAAQQAALSRTVAIKTIRGDTWSSTASDAASRDKLRADFIREALVAARLEHPNIAPVHNLVFSEGSGRPYLAMKLIRGETWHHLIVRDRDALPEADFLGRHLPVLERVAQAVAFAHASGIIHRDIKPGQVMVGKFGETVLMDWGLAVQFRAPAEASHRVQKPGEIPTIQTAGNPAGTPCLMAPEQTDEDTKRLGPHTDIYLLGGTLYFLLTGHYPHEAGTPSQAMYKASQGVVIPPNERCPDRWIPEELASLAMRALHANPERRVPSAEIFITELQDYQSGASRRRESETLVVMAADLAAGRRFSVETAHDLYNRNTNVAELISRALQLWPENHAALELKVQNLAASVRTEISGDDLQLAEIHLGQLREVMAQTPMVDCNLPKLEADLATAQKHRKKQQFQRTVFAWVAALLLLGHGIAMTYSQFRSQQFAEDMQQQKTELSRRADREVRAMSLKMAELLTAEGRHEEAIPHYAKAMVLSQVLDGVASEAALSAAKLLDEANKRVSATPPSTSD